MKNLFKRAAAASLAAVTALALAGCSDNSKSNDSGNAGNSSTIGGAEGKGGELVIGGIGPITGGASLYGIAVKNGAQLAVDEINAAGGVNGMTLKLDFQDDEHDPERSVNAYSTLKDNGMKLLVGTVTSAPCEAVSVEAAKDNMFMITPSGSSVECITAGDNCFRMCFTDPQQGEIEATYIAENTDAKRIGIIYDSSDSYSTGIVDGFESVAAAKGLTVVAKEAFTSDTNKDFSVQIQKMANANIDLLFMPFYYSEAALILQQAEGKLSCKYLGGDGMDGICNPEILGDKIALADGLMLMTPFAASSPEAKSKSFTDAYVAKFNDTPIQFAADAYDCVYAIKLALEKAGVNDASMSASDICNKVKAAMQQIELDGVTGKTTWGADGEPVKAPKVMKVVVKDGKGVYEEL